MTKIILINMPFAEWNRPSFALSQLSALIRRDFKEDIQVEIKYLNFDFAHYFGSELYNAIAGDLGHLLTGVGEWLFREVAFPGLTDNRDEYFRRYYQGERWHGFRSFIAERRAGLHAFCQELIDRYELTTADIVGFTSMFAQNVASIAMARLIKERNPAAVTVLGGANCEVPMGAVVAEQAEAIDAVFSGPALHTFPEFVQHIRAGNKTAIHQLRGVLTAENYGDLQFAGAVGRDRDVNDFVEPDYQSFVEAFSAHRDRLGRDVRPVLLFETSRGCWWGERSHCTFCGLNGLGMNYRAMSPEVAHHQFNWLFSFAPWCEEFSCTDNILPRNYPKEVFSKLVAPPNISLFYEVKLPVSERDMKMMAQAGVTKVQPGIEAMATETLKLMAKGTTSFLNLQFLKTCVAHGIEPKWNLLMGFPGEPVQVYRKYMEDIPLLMHLPPPAGAYMVRFDRFSPYFAKAEEYGLDLEPMDFYSLIYPFEPDQLRRLAYFFADQNNAEYMFNAIEWLKPVNDLIDRWRRAWTEKEHAPRLSLQLDEDGAPWILDTRGDQELRLDIDEDAHRLIRRLTSPVKTDRLADDLDISAQRAAACLAFLRAHGLVFQEDDRVISLVTFDDGNADEGYQDEVSQDEADSTRELLQLNVVGSGDGR